MSTVHLAPAPEASPDDNLDDFMAELDRDLKRPAAKKSPVKRVESWNNLPQVQVQWHPHSVALVVTTQRCACGCEAQSVTGLFLEDMTRNGASRQRRIEKEAIPPEYLALPRTLKEQVEQISVCPACFNPSVSTFIPPENKNEETAQTSGNLS